MEQTARRAVAEAIGTFFLVLIGPGAAIVDAATAGSIGHVGVSIAFGLVVMAMVFAIGHLSGAHINPAVTVAFWSVRRFPVRDVLPYVVAQTVGAVGAALALRWILPAHAAAGATVPGIPVGQALAVECLLSFVLMFVVMAVATDERVAGGFGAIAVGATVGFDAMMGGPLTGASMNPARSLGPALASGTWDAHWIYWVGPLTAMIAAARVYEALRRASAPATLPPGVPTGIEGPIDGSRRSG
jgi:aquaporin NIP